MKNFHTAFALSVAIMLSASCANSDPVDSPVLSAGSTLAPETTMTQQDYRDLLLTFTPEVAKTIASDPAKLQEALIELHSTEVLVASAEKQKLHEDPAVRAQIAEARAKILVNAYMNRQMRETQWPDDETLLQLAREDYLANPQRYTTMEARTVRHILIRPKDEACRCPQEPQAERVAKIQKQIENGVDFAELAREHSDDKTTARHGGLLPKPVKADGQTVEKFEAMTFLLTLDDPISGPVLTKFGVHIIKLEAIEPAKLQPFEEVKDQIVAAQRNKFFKTKLSEIKSATYPNLNSLNTDAFAELLKERVNAQ